MCIPISNWLSNIYLDPLDRAMAAAGIERVRYADDFVILSRSQRIRLYGSEEGGAARSPSPYQSSPEIFHQHEIASLLVKLRI